MSNTSDKKLHKWISRVVNNDMPIFGRTVQDIMSVSEDNTSSAIQLGEIVLKDAAMTSRVFKLANSVFYNASGHGFSTISQAIMMLGFNTVRNICLTVTLIDSLDKASHKERLINEMARSVHAAIQAQRIAEQRGDKDAEEIFIATLLFHIGDLAFWCFADKDGDKLDAALKEPDIEPIKAQRDTLGFSFQDLSQGLVEAWSLSDLLKKTLKNPRSSDPQYKIISLSHQFAKAVEQGWGSESVKSAATGISKLIGLSITDTMQALKNSAEQAIKTSKSFGSNDMAKVIPLPKTEDDDTQKNQVYLKPNPKLQLQFLSDMMKLSQSKTNFMALIGKTIGGIHQCSGMDNAMFAMLYPNHKGLHAKKVTGFRKDPLEKDFDFSFDARNGRLWEKIISDKNVLWINQEKLQQLNQEILPSTESVLNTSEFFAAPLFINNKPVGLFYADRSTSGRSLDSESFDSFSLFSQQSTMLLSILLSND